MVKKSLSFIHILGVRKIPSRDMARGNRGKKNMYFLLGLENRFWLSGSLMFSAHIVLGL